MAFAKQEFQVTLFFPINQSKEMTMMETSKEKKTSGLQTLFRLFRRRRSSPSSKKEYASAFKFFRRLFSRTKSSNKKKRRRLSKKSLKKLMKKMSLSSPSSESSPTWDDLVPGLDQVDTFETVSDSSSPQSNVSLAESQSQRLLEKQRVVRFRDYVEEYEYIPDDISSSIESLNDEENNSLHFEDELSFASKETLDLFPELDTHGQQNENFLTVLIDSDEEGDEDDVTYSSTMAMHGSSPLVQFCEFFFEAARSQDIFGTKAASRSKTNEDSSFVVFTPSHEGNALSNSYGGRVIESSQSAIVPYKVFKFDDHDYDERRRRAQWRFFAAVIIFAFLAAQETGSPPAFFLGQKFMTEVFVRSVATAGPLITKGFYNPHHTSIGAWLR